jgi:hypothetical protein
MVFESEGATYQCSGSLINSGGQAAPLFLTAHHCIGTEEEARSLITIFGYQTPACNGLAPSRSSLPRVSGSTLLEGEPMELGDFTLLRLSGFPNVDVKMLGWWPAEIAADERVTSISHPVGDYKRIALGQRTRDVTIRFDDGEQMPAPKGIQVAWFEGVTQGGSSGSPLLANLNGSEYVVGTLSAGPVVDEGNDRQVCRTRNMVASFGRFAAAYPYLERYLTAADTPGSGVTFSASPNPVVPAGPTGLGLVTLSWNAPGLARVQVRVNSPEGPVMTGVEPGAGTASTGEWVTDGMTFYLQDAGSGDSSGGAKTLATVRVGIGAGR